MKRRISYLLLLLSLSALSSADAWQDKYMLLLQPSMTRAVKKWAEGFDITRTVRIQGHLLEEDIEWGNSTSDEKDRALCVALSLYAARARAQKELREMIVLTAAQRVTADSIQTFIDLAPAEIAKWRKKAEGITDAHVKRLYLSH